MSVVTSAVVARLKNDATLAALLAEYESEAAVFSTDPPPDNAELPYIITAGDVSTAPMDTKTTLGRTVRRDIRCYTEGTDSALLVEQIAERVRYLFHRQTLTITGFDNYIAECSGPLQVDEEENLGRIVTVRLVMEET